MDWFLSYSRKEFYFADELVSKLKDAGLSIWFDYEQLEPGINWCETIDKALENSKGVILVISKASLESPYVTHEWQHALKQGKPLIIVIFERISHEQRLVQRSENCVLSKQNEVVVNPKDIFQYASSIVDMRSQFDAALPRLISALKGDAAVHDNWDIPSLPLDLPAKLPSTVLFIAAAALFLVVLALHIALDSMLALRNWALVGAALATTIGLVIALGLFLRRDSFRGIHLSLFIGILLVPVFAPWPFAIIPLAAVGLMFSSKSVHRFAPLGSSPRGAFVQKRREVISSNDSLLGRQILIRSSDQDIPIANQIMDLLNHSGYSASFQVTEPDLTLAMISDYTTDDIIKNIISESGRKHLLILCSSLQDKERFRSLTHWQWVDIRQTGASIQQASLISANRFARKAQKEKILKAAEEAILGAPGSRAVPQNFQKILVPAGVALFIVVNLLFLVYGAGSLGFILGILPFSFGNSQTSPFIGELVVSFGYGLITTAIAIWVLNRIIRREINLRSIIIFSTLSGILGVLFTIWVQSTQLAADPREVTQELTRTIPQIIIFAFLGRKQLRTIYFGDWLPPKNSFPKDLMGLSRDKHLWASNGFMMLAAILLSAAIFSPTNRTIVSTISVEGFTIPVASDIATLYDSNHINQDPIISSPIGKLLRHRGQPIGIVLGNLIDTGIYGEVVASPDDVQSVIANYSPLEVKWYGRLLGPSIDFVLATGFSPGLNSTDILLQIQSNLPDSVMSPIDSRLDRVIAHGFVQDNTRAGNMVEIEQWFVVLNAASGNYLITIGGLEADMDRNRLLLEEWIKSIN